MSTGLSRRLPLGRATHLGILVGSALGLSFAQNSAISFTSSRPVPMTLRPYSIYTPPTYGAVCNILFAGRFHPGPKTDLAGTCANTFSEVEYSTVLLNQGNGTFRDVEDPDTDAASAYVIAAADLNGDGFTDLIINVAPAGQYSPEFGVEINNGDGTFKKPVYYTPAGHGVADVQNIVVGDFENRSRTDVAVITIGGVNNVLENYLTIFTNDGTGQLTQSAAYTLPPSASNFEYFPLLIAGDLNGDHRTDLVYFDTTRQVFTPFLSEGNSRFTRGGTFGAGKQPFSAVIGTFENGFKADLAIATNSGVKVMSGDGHGDSQPPDTRPTRLRSPTLLPAREA